MNPKTILPFLCMIFLFACKHTDEAGNAGFHFSGHGLTVDAPVELIFLNGTFHLFYTGTSDDGEHELAHAQTTDLIHWEYLPKNAVPSVNSTTNVGSIVVDWNNTCGLGTEGPLLVALNVQGELDEPVTGSDFQELNLWYSRDEGATWETYEGVPVVLNDLYEKATGIKVIWHDETQQWVMLVLAGYEIRFYTSGDLINWEFISSFGEDIYLKSGNWTHVDFFPMEVAGTNEMKWMLFISSDEGSPNEGSGIQYFVGDFDGYVYQSTHNKPKWLDHGSDAYAGIVLSDYGFSGKPPIFIAGIFNSIYQKFNIHPEKAAVLTFPRQLELKERFNDYYLCSFPVPTNSVYRAREQAIPESKLTGEQTLTGKHKLPLEIDLTFDVNDRLYLGLAEVFGIRLTNAAGQEILIGYHAQRRYFFITDPAIPEQFPGTWDGFNYAPYVLNEPTVDIKIIIDHSSLELFAVGGLISLTRKYAFSDEQVKVSLFAQNGNITLLKGQIVSLKNIPN